MKYSPIKTALATHIISLELAMHFVNNEPVCGIGFQRRIIHQMQCPILPMPDMC